MNLFNAEDFEALPEVVWEQSDHRSTNRELAAIIANQKIESILGIKLLKLIHQALSASSPQA